MKINIGAYNEHYHQSGKFIDNWQEGIKLLPFNSTPASAYDKKCGLHGTTGEFFRLWDNDGAMPIENFEKSAVEPVKEYLTNQKQMPNEQILEFVRMTRDILFINGNLNITDSAFLKYLPLVPMMSGFQKRTEKNIMMDKGSWLITCILCFLMNYKILVIRIRRTYFQRFFRKH